MSTFTNEAIQLARFDGLQAATRRHRRRHGCSAYTFEDGPGLLAIARDDYATRILELGTALGYTACVLASATGQTHVDTIESDPQHVALARQQIRDLGLELQITVRPGEFFEVMAELNGPYDLAFFDGIGPTAQIVARLRELLRPEGLLVCGNMAHIGGAERPSISAELETSGRWRLIGKIEGGGTFVFRKSDSGALPPFAPIIKGD